MNGQMLGNQHKSFDYSPYSAAFDGLMTNWHIVLFHRFRTDDAKDIICNHAQFQNECIGIQFTAGHPFYVHICFDFTMELFTDRMIMVQFDNILMSLTILPLFGIVHFFIVLKFGK